MRCLPDNIFGYDSDDLLGYCTTKQAFVRDANLGCIFYPLTIIFAFGMISLSIFVNNSHFQRLDVYGTPRLWFTHPVRLNQNGGSVRVSNRAIPDLTNFKDLPYCLQGKLDNNQHAEATRNCTVKDRVSIVGVIAQDQNKESIFIPTSTKTKVDMLQCNASLPGCDANTADYHTIHEESYFVADIERFFVQMGSTFERGSNEGLQSKSSLITGHSSMVEGKLEYCTGRGKAKAGSRKRRSFNERVKMMTQDRNDLCDGRGKAAIKNIACLKGEKCQENFHYGDGMWGTDSSSDEDDDIQMDGSKFMGNESLQSALSDNASLLSNASSLLAKALGAPSASREQKPPGMNQWSDEELDMFKLRYADVFRLGKLLELADIDLDNDVSPTGATTRESGTIVDIEFVYNNMYRFWSSFGYRPVEYTIKVKELPVTMMVRQFHDFHQPSNFPQMRRTVQEHGILINAKVSGEFGFFNIVYLIVWVSVFLTVLAAAQSITEFVMLYVLPRKSNYFHSVYEVSPHFGDLWRCHTCQFMNDADSAACQGVERWVRPLDASVSKCGRLRPVNGSWKHAAGTAGGGSAGSAV